MMCTSATLVTLNDFSAFCAILLMGVGKHSTFHAVFILLLLLLSSSQSFGLNKADPTYRQAQKYSVRTKIELREIPSHRSIAYHAVMIPLCFFMLLLVT